MDDIYDVIAVGSGINSLVLAAQLSLRGKRVLVLERESIPGGCLKSAELTLPGYRHDVFATSVPAFVTAPHYGSLGPALAQEGLKVLTGDRPTAVLTPDGRSLVLTRDRQSNILELDAVDDGDGKAFARAMAEIKRDGYMIDAFLGSEVLGRANVLAIFKLWRQRGVTGMSQFGGNSLRSLREWLEDDFRSDLPRALIAPWILHCGLDPEAPMSAMMGKLILSLIESAGAPVIEGGIANLVEALGRIIARSEGRISCDQHVERVQVKNGRATGVITADGAIYSARRAVACNVTPQQLYGALLQDAHVPPNLASAARSYRYGRSGMQIHLALSEPASWRDPALNDVALVHLTAGLDAVSCATNEAARGLLPSEPTIVVGQPTTVDPSRCPPGAGILWLQLLELPSAPKADASGEISVDPDRGWTLELKNAYAERVLDRLSVAIPQLRSTILGSHILSPSDLAKQNINLVGGDPYSGACGIEQFHWFRPPTAGSHRTSIRNLYHIGASSHPGPSVAGLSGHIVSTLV
ncbi:NAD(P)/FAD-dependent oxidoreductase (plasmid) [Agrobacterium tumefaciens]|uniref:NAD(P)/FAD-dependent oxidoreductase n=1 Tax=Agrobacterium tumefaciens TaxID=358 RepID=A0AAJ4N8R6_AGRTU|nr:NAD(P)/FAD-dependent oxidoreductase [Agrobacterium tumefaciens]